MLALHGSEPSAVTHWAVVAHTVPGTQPLSSRQKLPDGQAVGPVSGPTTCEHTPALHASTVHENPSLQSAADEQPPDPPVPVPVPVLALVVALPPGPGWPPPP